ncbi:MAG: RNA helicase [Moraxellaceae bacterium]|nr:MAG: RNA helicase [Moraxellaceae bacterium]
MYTDLDDSLIQAISEAGFKTLTPVQKETIDPALDGQDLFVSAETGSGKTVAYLLPTLERLLACQSDATLALILVPTRELAQQVLRQAKLFARYTKIKLGLIGGGTDIKKQIEYIKQPPQLLIATPGRLSELLARDLLDFSEVNMLILDEADRLLDMGFGDEIIAISEHCANREQTQLYSATLASKTLRGLAEKLLTDPTVVELNKVSDPHKSIQQQIIFADDKGHKYQLLCWLLKNEEYRHCLVFSNSKEQTDQLYSLMQQQGISAGVLHGDKDQKQRNLVMSKMRRDQLKVIIATDVASRGLDIEGMDLVINFEMPRRGELYVHRIGRTGRAGQTGKAITLIMSTEFNLMAGIERFLKQKFERRKIKELIGNYKGPKKLKASGKAAGTKKKIKKKIKKVKVKK